MRLAQGFPRICRPSPPQREPQQRPSPLHGEPERHPWLPSDPPPAPLARPCPRSGALDPFLGAATGRWRPPGRTVLQPPPWLRVLPPGQSCRSLVRGKASEVRSPKILCMHIQNILNESMCSGMGNGHWSRSPTVVCMAVRRWNLQWHAQHASALFGRHPPHSCWWPARGHMDNELLPFYYLMDAKVR